LSNKIKIRKNIFIQTNDNEKKSRKGIEEKMREKRKKNEGKKKKK
jgi:hypothetical protein